MPLSNQKPKAKTAEQLKAEVRDGQIRLEKDTKVVALELGYSDLLREPGDVFYVKKGTIYTPGVTWFEPVNDKTLTKEESDSFEDMSVAELKVELAKAGIEFAANAKKADLVSLLAEHRASDDLV